MTSKQSPLPGRLAVCSWSLQPATPQELADRLSEIGIRAIQLELDPMFGAPDVWSAAESVFEKNSITAISGMLRSAGEDYTTLETIKQTGGITPDATWEENLKNFRAGALIASRLKLKLITLHAGFFPHKTEPDYKKIKERLETIAGIFAEQNIALGLETGQETADELADVMQDLSCKNIGVNFDPANMLLYNKGNPVEALRTLAPWLLQIHIKDATRAKTPGAWGDEVPVGAGEVDWAEFFATLRDLNYNGNYAIEREAGDQRVADIRTAREFVSKYI